MSMEEERQLERALDVMRRMPPQNSAQFLANLIDLCPNITEELLSAIDQPLHVSRDELKQKDYIICDYNRDGDSFRSPWSDTYFPMIDDGYHPPIQLRVIEEELNSAFKLYTDMYYGDGALSSVYVWDIDNGFAAAILIRKLLKGEINGCWDAINVMEVTERLSRPTHYKLTTTVMMRVLDRENAAPMDLGGSIMRQKEEDMYSDNGHVVNIGPMVEEMENNIRQQIEGVYFGRTRDIVNGVRSLTSLSHKTPVPGFSNELCGAISKRKQPE